MRLGDTPVPIPNTMVKTQAADGTMLETAWESRWLPDHKKRKQKRKLQETAPGAEAVHIEGGEPPPSTAGHAVAIDCFLPVI